MMKKLLLVGCFILNWVCSNAQQYFNDTLWFNADYSIARMVYPTDTGTFIVAQKGYLSTGQLGEIVLGFVDTNGTKRVVYHDFESSNDQRLLGSSYNLFLNQDSNFVLAYANNEQGIGAYVRIKEISPQGMLIRDVHLDTILTNLHYGIGDYTRLIQRRSDSMYILNMAAVDMTLPSDDQKMGVLLTILNPDFSIDTVLFYSDPTLTYSYLFLDAVELDSSKSAMLMCRIKFAAPSVPENQQFRLFLDYLDSEGVITETYTYAEQEKTTGTSLVKSLGEDGYVTALSYFYPQGHGNTLLAQSYLAKFDKQLHLVWRTVLNERLLASDLINFGPKKVIATSDSNYLALMLDWNGADTNQTAARITKINPEGEIIWNRFFYRYDRHNFDTLNPPSHDLSDMQETPDGGFVFAGQVWNWDGFVQQVPFQTAWMVKVNCLGFIGPPSAAVAWQSGNENTVSFYNTSLQAANYHWDFGDGSTFEVDDSMDTLFHHYQDTGTYTATLIAYGCRETDTLHFTVKVMLEPEDTVNNAGEGYFTFYPNPIISGNTLYVYLNGMNEVKSSTIDLTFYDYSGNLVRAVSLSSKEGNYMIPNQLSSGMYFVHLTQNGENIAVKKLVVQ